jgi:F420-dependent oxidoreductase-like protein
VARARRAEELGFDSIWVNQMPDARDATLVLSEYARATTTLGLGTGVLPIYTRHPTAMVQAAATLDELSGGRFRLGIGLGHRVLVEDMWGLKLESPAAAMGEYLRMVRAGLREGGGNDTGRFFTANWRYSGPRREELPILLASLGPRMLDLAGEHADGVVLWMCSPAFIAGEVVPRVRAARERAGKTLEGFEIVAAVPISLTTDVAAGLDQFRKTATMYAGLPFYRKALESGGFAEDLATGAPTDRMLKELGGIGDEAAVRDAIRRYRDAGTTLPAIGPFQGYEGAAGFEATVEAAAT